MSFKSYITSADYLAVIQDGQLNDQILDELNEGKRQRRYAESWAISQVRSKLKSKYDLDFEITDTLPYNPKQVYYAGSRVIIDYDNWESKKYKQFECVIKDSVGYICIVEESSETWDESQWQTLGAKYTIYHIPLPYPRFSINIQEQKGISTNGFYKVGDFVWWANHTYKALRQTITLNHDTTIQYYSTSDLPSPNTFPNDPEAGALFWEDLGEYSIGKYSDGTDGSLPVGTEDAPSKWIEGDNRDISLVQCIIDLSLWILHKRISPMNIPVLREKSKEMAFAWLSGVKNSDNDTDLESLQPEQGESFRWGSQIKQINTW